MIVIGSIDHLVVRLSERVMVVLGDGVKGPDGYLKLSVSKWEQHHLLGEQSQPLAELPHPLAYQGVEDHPPAGQKLHYFFKTMK